MQSRQGVMHFRIKGKRDKIRFVPVHPMALRLIGNIWQWRNTAGGRMARIWTVPSSAP
jgi:hypothetical protein